MGGAARERIGVRALEVCVSLPYNEGEAKTMATARPAVKSGSKKRDQRLDARVTREEKEAIETAARLRGTSSSDFVRMAIKEAALNTIREYEFLTLAGDSRKVFVEALLNPPKPNEKAVAAARRFRQEIS
jgi:uncharacterized protein (DUF1778 family)